jgi:hypothetical protein
VKKELEDRLYKEFPELYQGMLQPDDDYPMQYGFECEDGWFDLIYKLSSEIVMLSRGLRIGTPTASQVKQKLGELRFHFADDIPEQFYNLTDTAKANSKMTCEVCGKPGKTGRVGKNERWIQTLCDNHGKKYVRKQ